MSGQSLALRLAATGQLRRFGVGGRPVRIGFFAPLTGPAQTWGLPGLLGCEIWADWINRAGGLLVGGRRHPVELVPFDAGSATGEAQAGVRALIGSGELAFLLALGGEPLGALLPLLTRTKTLAATLLPSDLSPDTPYLIAPSEIHPLYTVTAVDWLARNRPHLRRVALCTQEDAVGTPARAAYRAAFRAAGWQLTADLPYDPAKGDAGALVAAMMASGPQILCWGTSTAPMVHALTEAAFHAGFKGQILSCTIDDYPRLIARTSAGFLQGALFQFPDFDDPGLADRPFYFHRPAEFFADYNRRFPGRWSAVSWEYVAALDIWQAAVEAAGTTAAPSVLAAMKRAGRTETIFGAADWRGQELFGIAHALVGDWPVVEIDRGRARIVAFGSIPDWLSRHRGLMIEEMTALGQMWHQRAGRGAAATGAAESVPASPSRDDRPLPLPEAAGLLPSGR